MMNLRAHAAKTLAPVFRKEHSLQSSFDAAVGRVEPRDRGLFHELIYGSLRQFEWLEAAFDLLVDKKLKSKDADIKALIFLGLYQIVYLRTPDHAAISETVSAAAKLKKHWAKGFINGVLRRFLREQESLSTDIGKRQTAEHCAPWWLIKQLKEDWPDTWPSILEQTGSQPPITIRNNRSAQSRDDILAELESRHIDIALCPFSTDGFSLSNSSNINDLIEIQSGKVSVQDEAAQLAAALLDLNPNVRVLDACAAPGGKTGHILEYANVHLTALELDADRAIKIQENLDRLQFSANIKVCDAADLDSWWDGQVFDRILLDAPCSATGVIRRHPDIKLLRREDDLVKLAEIQAALLSAMWQCLAPGGVLIYATCSILKQENEHIIRAFLASNNDAEHCTIEAEWGEPRPFGRQLTPQTGGHDGFYYAKLKKA